MGTLFGTDGVRGRWGRDLTEDLVRGLGAAAVEVLSASTILIGRDTRASGLPIERALAHGIQSAGGHAMLAGVLPTAGVAALVRLEGFDAAAVISASHNPASDNGIKFFGSGGMKLSDSLEHMIEALTLSPPSPPGNVARATHGETTAEEVLGNADDTYVDFLIARRVPLGGMRIVVDAANGAAHWVGPEVFRRVGADVQAINTKPDGLNINDGCGSTHPEGLQRRVVEGGAHIGLAFDGDADRLIAVDENGDLVDGDQVLAICAIDRKRRGELKGNAVVSTVMANLGFHEAMEREGIEVVETAVGDRYVLAALLERGLELGGEQSGHVIFLDRHTTGDGILTALELLGVMSRTGQPLSKLAAVSPRHPQVLINIEVENRDRLDDAKDVWDEVVRARDELGGSARILLRPSGTEPVIRVMVQAANLETARAVAERVSAAVRKALG